MKACGRSRKGKHPATCPLPAGHKGPHHWIGTVHLEVVKEPAMTASQQKIEDAQASADNADGACAVVLARLYNNHKDNLRMVMCPEMFADIQQVIERRAKATQQLLIALGDKHSTLPEDPDPREALKQAIARTIKAGNDLMLLFGK